MSNTISKDEYSYHARNSSKNNIINLGPSERNRALSVSYPEISDEDAIKIANGISIVERSSFVANDETINAPEFETCSIAAPILFEPTKKTQNGREYRGTRMLRRGSRNKNK